MPRPTFPEDRHLATLGQRPLRRGGRRRRVDPERRTQLLKDLEELVVALTKRFFRQATEQIEQARSVGSMLVPVTARSTR